MAHFSTDNTNGYTPAQLERANEAVTSEIKEQGLDINTTFGRDQYKALCERVLEDVE